MRAMWCVLLLAVCFPCASASFGQSSSDSDEFFRRREREVLATIQKQVEADGGPALPLLPDGRRLARRIETVVNGRVRDEGKGGPAPGWKYVEVYGARWDVRFRVAADAQDAVREMARYISHISAAFFPGTMSGALIGQARYHSGDDAIVFLRGNVVVWLDGFTSGYRWPSRQAQAKECEAVALQIDREVRALAANQ